MEANPIVNNELQERIARIDNEIATFQKMLINGSLASIRKFTEAELILNFARVGLQSCEVSWWLTDFTLIEFATTNWVHSRTIHIGTWSDLSTLNYECMGIAFKRLGFELVYEHDTKPGHQLHYSIQRNAFSLFIYPFKQGYEYTWQVDAFQNKRFYHTNFYIDSSKYFPIPATFPLYSEEQYGRYWNKKYLEGDFYAPVHNELIPCETTVRICVRISNEFQLEGLPFDSWSWTLVGSPRMHGMTFIKNFFEVGLGIPIILCQESLFYWISQKCETDHEVTSNE
jgi:hypothetical protein